MLDYLFCRPPEQFDGRGEGNIDDRNYPYSELRAIRRQRP